MIKQYPHRLKFSQDGVTPAPVYDPATGNFEDALTAPPTAYDLPCRMETTDARSGAKTIVSEDGQEVIVTFEVMLKRNTPRVEIGAFITVKDGDVTIGDGTVKRYHKNQLHSRIWV